MALPSSFRDFARFFLGLSRSSSLGATLGGVAGVPAADGESSLCSPAPAAGRLFLVPLRLRLPVPVVLLLLPCPFLVLPGIGQGTRTPPALAGVVGVASGRRYVHTSWKRSGVSSPSRTYSSRRRESSSPSTSESSRSDRALSSPPPAKRSAPRGTSSGTHLTRTADRSLVLVLRAGVHGHRLVSVVLIWFLLLVIPPLFREGRTTSTLVLSIPWN